MSLEGTIEGTVIQGQVSIRFVGPLTLTCDWRECGLICLAPPGQIPSDWLVLWEGKAPDKLGNGMVFCPDHARIIREAPR